jgi:arsenite methyltransferase
MDSQEIYDRVRAHYSAASQGTTAAYGSAIAKSFGYSDEELTNAPEGSNLGLSCGNPLAVASVSEVCYRSSSFIAPLANRILINSFNGRARR